jgi:hypothetical protein
LPDLCFSKYFHGFYAVYIDNSLMELPHAITALTSLESLNLDNNQLQCLPTSLLREMRQLKSISVKGNTFLLQHEDMAHARHLMADRGGVLVE